MRDCLSTLPVPSVTTLPSGKVDVHDFPTNNTLTRPSLAKLIQLATLQHHADKFTAVVSTSDTFPSPQQSGSDQPSDCPLPDTLSSSVLSGSKHPSASPMLNTPSLQAMLEKTPASPITQLVSRSPTTPRTKSEAIQQVPKKVVKLWCLYKARPTKQQVAWPARLGKKIYTIIALFESSSQLLRPLLDDRESFKKENSLLKTELNNLQTQIHNLKTSSPNPPVPFPETGGHSTRSTCRAPKAPFIDFVAVPTSNRFSLLQEDEDEKSEEKPTDAESANDDTAVSVHTETATDSNASTDADANRTYDVTKEKDAEDRDSSRCNQ